MTVGTGASDAGKVRWDRRSESVWIFIMLLSAFKSTSNSAELHSYQMNYSTLWNLKIMLNENFKSIPSFNNF